MHNGLLGIAYDHYEIIRGHFNRELENIEFFFSDKGRLLKRTEIEIIRGHFDRELEIIEFFFPIKDVY